MFWLLVECCILLSAAVLVFCLGVYIDQLSLASKLVRTSSPEGFIRVVTKHLTGKEI